MATKGTKDTKRGATHRFASIVRGLLLFVLSVPFVANPDKDPHDV